MTVITIDYNDHNLRDQFPKKSVFKDKLQALLFMIDRDWRDYTLYINGREYTWPPYTEFFSNAVLEDHLDQCIDLDKALWPKS